MVDRRTAPDSGLIIPGRPTLHSRKVTLDLAAIEQRIRIAQSSPDATSRINAKNLVVGDCEDLLQAARNLFAELEGLKERHQQLLQNATTAGVLLALVMVVEPEWRWTKAFVEAFVPAGGWILEEDPLDPDGWLLRMGVPAPIVSAEEQMKERIQFERDDDPPKDA